MFAQNQSINPYYINNKPSFFANAQTSRNQFSNKIDQKNYQLEENSFSDSRTCIDTQTQYAFNKKKPTEELNNLIINVIDNTIPKIADHCANIILKKIGTNLKNQNEEIEEIDKEIKVMNKNLKKNQETNNRICKKKIEKLNKEFNDFTNFYEKNEVKFNKNFVKTLKEYSSECINNLEELKENINEVDNQMQIDSESVSVKLENSIKEKKANVIIMKKQIDDKIIPLEIAIDKQFNSNSDFSFCDKDFLFIKEMSDKFDNIQEKISIFCQKKSNSPNKIKQMNESSLMIDDYSTNASFIESFNKNRQIQKVRNITNYGNIKLF